MSPAATQNSPITGEEGPILQHQTQKSATAKCGRNRSIRICSHLVFFFSFHSGLLQIHAALHL